jgi:uncharacterized membrane protein HdeD (DUF308 family)
MRVSVRAYNHEDGETMNDIKSEIKSGASSMKWMGVLTFILGILAMTMPYVTGESVLTLIGILVMAGGIMRMIWAFKAGSLGKGILVFLIGVLTLLAGFWIITEPFIAAGALTIVLSVYFFADGIAEIMAAFSLTEGKGLALIEAMAAGRPALGTPIGGIKEVIKDQRNGWLASAASSSTSSPSRSSGPSRPSPRTVALRVSTRT